jgi:hypothetical protein
VSEQALHALKLDVDTVPLPSVPDRVEDLASDLGLIVDDPPGLTPEQRRAVAAFVTGGGVVLLALGPHAASAPLGATLEPMLGHAVGWAENHQRGASAESATGPLAESGPGLADLGAPRRAVVAAEDARGFESLVAWADGAPLVARRSLGRGEVWIVTLPFSVDASDLALRPAFLALLEAWVHAAQERAAPRRTVAGTPWSFPGAVRVTAIGPDGPVPAERDERALRLVAPVLGVYRITVDGKEERRVAAPDPRELDLRPRAAVAANPGESAGERRADVDMSGAVALTLLALMALEMLLRRLVEREAHV